jgi:excisionase family DNA binding protein
LITVTAAAARLNLSGARVRQLIAQGRIAAVKVTPRMWLVREPVKVLPPRSG